MEDGYEHLGSTDGRILLVDFQQFFEVLIFVLRSASFFPLTVFYTVSFVFSFDHLPLGEYNTVLDPLRLAKTAGGLSRIVSPDRVFKSTVRTVTPADWHIIWGCSVHLDIHLNHSWAEIERYESKQYSPLREFGGWGIRWAPGKLAYNVSGNRGVLIERTNGRTVLVGSQHVEEFISAIDETLQ